MPGNKNNYFNCVVCTKRTKPNERTCVTKEIKKFLRRKFLLDPKDNDIICNKCRHIYRKEKTYNPSIKTSSNPRKQKSSGPQLSPPSVTLKFHSTSRTHAYCCVCKKAGSKLVVIPPHARTSAFIENEILIPSGNRCCSSHLVNGKFTSETLETISRTTEAFVNRSYIVDLMGHMRNKIKESENRRLSFDEPTSLNDEDFFTLTGLKKSDFNDLSDSVSKLLKNTPVRSIRTSLAIFLCKLKSGLSNRFLCTLFNISKSSVRRAITSVRNAFKSEFVPTNLGFGHISREDVITKHTRPMAQSIFGTLQNNSVILVLDGTYIYIDKSNNFQFQRRSYSLHKGRPLVKPMIVVTTTGYFVSALGPYMADYKNNDANILTHMMKTNVEEIRNWVREEDIFILDRGFRDAIPLLKDLGIQAEMPRFLKKSEKQFSDEDANMSRLVTKVRWVVESSNARIKSWKFLSLTLPTNQIPYIGDYVSIVCALSNKYAQPLGQCKDAEIEELEAAKMLTLSKQTNSLKQFVESENLIRKQTSWKVTSETELNNFPRLGEEELRNITCGVYQVKLAPCYIQEYLDQDSDIFFHKDNHNLLRVKIQSRHTSSRKHQLWIKYREERIESWYCLCRSGARVVGACAHVAAVLWYLGQELYKENSVSIGVRNWGKYIDDASVIPNVIDDSDSGSESDTGSIVEE